jgi:hypothetical protein
MRLSLPYAVALCLTDHVTICRARSPLDSFRPTEGQHRGRDEWVLLTLGDAAKLLGFQKGSVYEQSRAGRIPVMKLVRYRRYPREAVEAEDQG